MPTMLDTTAEMQQKFLAGLEVSQKAIVSLVGTWAESVELAYSKLPDLTKDPVKPAQIIESVTGFAEKVLASQRDFATQVFQAAMPASPIPAPKTTAKT